jgi:hypothetical protein
METALLPPRPGTMPSTQGPPSVLSHPYATEAWPQTWKFLKVGSLLIFGAV